MTNIWAFLLQTTSVTVVGVFLLLIKKLFDDKLSPRWQYGIFSLLALRILLPVGTAKQILLPLPLLTEYCKSLLEQHLISSYSATYEPLQLTSAFPLLSNAPQSVTDWLFLIYVAGIFFHLLNYFISYIRLRLLLKEGTPVSIAIQERLDAVCTQYKLTSCRTVSVSGLSSAFVCGIIRPVLALPEDNDIDEKILLHELMHLKYHDALQNTFWCLLRTLHWCNPVLQIIFNRIENDMEALCDQRVLEQLEGEERREYGTILLRMANETYARAIGTSSISNGGKNISRRITAIVRFKKYPKGMALVSICILLILAGPTIIGTAKNYDDSYYTPVGNHSIDLSMALSRITRCTTVAGALDTYAKGLLYENGIYLATASPLSMQEELHTALNQNNSWHFGTDLSPAHVTESSDYFIYNLNRISDDRYEALLILTTSYVDENSLKQLGYIILPVEIFREDTGHFVVHETGERIISDKSPNAISYSPEFSDVPWLTEITAHGKTGTVTQGIKLSYHMDNSVQETNSGFFAKTVADKRLRPDAEFSYTTLEVYTLYSCENNSLGIYPDKAVGYKLVIIDEKEELIDFMWPSDEELMRHSAEEEVEIWETTVNGSSTGGFNWGNRILSDSWDYTIEDLSTRYCYPVDDEFLLQLPWGHKLQIYWDGEPVEEFTLETEISYTNN